MRSGREHYPVATIPNERSDRTASAETIQLSVPPVPILRIVEAHLNLRLLYDKIPQDGGERILAYIDPFDRIICLNTLHQDLFEEVIGTEAFTLAHECGHWELHVLKSGRNQPALSFAGAGQGERFLCRANSSDPREYQANRFAAALLMPRYLVLAMTQGQRLNRWTVLEKLAKDFGVSKEAFKIRLENLNLIRVDGNLIHQLGQPARRTSPV
jgi:Zn-dependent peptidase ImmA (M78 family)